VPPFEFEFAKDGTLRERTFLFGLKKDLNSIIIYAEEEMGTVPINIFL
jgi:hypothetical protein